jgi:Nitroreductase family
VLSGDGVRVHLDRGPIDGSSLFDAIPRRQSTRSDFGTRRVGAADLQTLGEAAKMPGVELVLITERRGIDRVRDLVLAGNDLQMADPAFMRELVRWLRFNPSQAREVGDGLYSAASGNPPLPSWLGPRAFDVMVTAKSERDRYARQLDTSSGIAVFVGAQTDRAHWVAVGRACERFALQATALGIKHAFVNQPVEVPTLRPELAALIGMADHRPDLVMRFGYAPTCRSRPDGPLA